jgi:hypothetical protein
VTIAVGLASGVLAALASSTAGAPIPAGNPVPALTPVAARTPHTPRGEWLIEIARAIERSEYAFSPLEDGSWSAPNRAQNLRARLSAAGLEIGRRSIELTPGADRRFRLRLLRYGREGALADVDRVPPAVSGNRVELRRPALGLTEWYVNHPRGLEQGFTIDIPPRGGNRTGRLILEMERPGDLDADLAADGRSVLFTTPTGAGVVRYAGLEVRDAGGRPLEAVLAVDPGRLLIRIKDDDAAYPIIVDPLMTIPDWTAEGNLAEARFGFSVASAGDVNGDGFADVIIGAQLYDGGEDNEGRVFVFYGSGSGLGATADWIAECDQAGARFGYSVASAGDVNGDGFGDIIVGAPYYDIAPGDDFGVAVVWFGSAAGLNPTKTKAIDADWGADGGQVDSRFGWSVASMGDVNNDGFSEVMIGAPLYEDDPVAQANEGWVFAYAGSAAGPSFGPAWRAQSDQAGARLGYSVAPAGSVNGDPFADVIVGAPYYDTVAGDNRGWVFVFHGPPGGRSGGPIATVGDADWSAESDQNSSRFGRAVAAAGDVNGDGFGDVIVGAYLYDNPDASEGMAFVWHGGAGGLGPHGVPANADWSAESDQGSAQLGTSVASAGDVDNDGFSEVIVGAPLYDDAAADNRGRVFVFHGSPGGPSGGPVATVADADWAAQSDVAGARFGQSVAGAGDVNGDMLGDVVVGASLYTNPDANEGAAFLYHGFVPPAFLEFGPSGDPGRIEAEVIAYAAVTGLVTGEYVISGDASVTMGSCAVPADCTRPFSFAGLTAVNDPTDTAGNGDPAFRITAGTATVNAVAAPILFPEADDLDLSLLIFSLSPAGGAIVPGGLKLLLPGSMRWETPTDSGQELTFGITTPIDQDLNFATPVSPGPDFWFAPKDYPFRIVPQPGVVYQADRQRVELGLSDYIDLDKERGTDGPPGSGCAVAGACLERSNDGIFRLAWTLNQYAGGGAPAGSIGTPYLDHGGLRATLYLTAEGVYTPLFPAGTFITVGLGSIIELLATDPGGGAITGALTLSMRTGAVVGETGPGGAQVFDDCTGIGSVAAGFTSGQVLSGGQLRIGSLTPQGGWTELSWGGSGPGIGACPNPPHRGFFAGGLDAGNLSFYAPGSVARLDPAGPRSTLPEHLLAEQDGRSGAGIYAGLNLTLDVANPGTVGLDTSCPPMPAGGGHSLEVPSGDSQLYARASGVSGIADGGNLDPPLFFPYMGYDMTLSNFAAAILDNTVQEPGGSGVVIERVGVPLPSDIELFFDSPASITGCAEFDESLGEMANAGTPDTLTCWEADFTPFAARFELADPDAIPDDPRGCFAEAPGSCPDLAACPEDIRYIHVASRAPFELEPGNPPADRFAEEVPIDFTPGPEGDLKCSDIVPAAASGSIRNEFEPDYGFDVDLTHASLRPKNPYRLADGCVDDDPPRYEVEGETLFPFYGGTPGCTVVTQGGVEIGGLCDLATSMSVKRKVIAGLFDLEFDLAYFDPIRDPVDDLEKTSGRFLAKSAKLDLKFFEVPTSIKLFGDRPAVPGLPPADEVEHPEIYFGFLSDLAAYAEARGNLPSCDPDCQATFTELIKFDPALPEVDIDDVLPGIESYYDELFDELGGEIGNIRALAATTMKETVGDVLPADLARAADRVKGAVDGLREGTDMFLTKDLTGFGQFEFINDPEAPDFVLRNIALDSDVDIVEFVDFKGYVEFNAHTANTADDTDDTADVTIGATDADIDWVIGGVRVKRAEATFFFEPPPDFEITGFEGEFTVQDLEFGDVTVDEASLCLGMGSVPAEGEFYYVAGAIRGKYKSSTAAAGFFLGKSIDLEPIFLVDPNVGEFLEGIDRLEGVYVSAEASIPILSSPDCFPFNLTAGGGAAFWLFAQGPTFGAKMRNYAHGNLACVVSARADMTLLGGLTNDVWRLSGYGMAAGGIGLCEPGDWDTRRDVLRDDWCLACVLDGEFTIDSESAGIHGSFDGPDCR